MHERALYNELLEIGNKQRCIAPHALAGYPTLLKTSEVQRRAGRHPTSNALTLAASEAIADAIASIVNPRDRLIATAALGASPEFAGELMKTRLEAVARLPDGCNIDAFKRGRRRAFQRIADYLERGERQADSLTTSQIEVSVSAIAAYDYVAQLDDDAERLHLAGLTLLLAVKHPWLRPPLEIEVPDSMCCHDALFDAYVSFLKCALDSLDINDRRRSGVRFLLTPKELRQVTILSDDLRLRGPLPLPSEGTAKSLWWHLTDHKEDLRSAWSALWQDPDAYMWVMRVTAQSAAIEQRLGKYLPSHLRWRSHELNVLRAEEILCNHYAELVAHKTISREDLGFALKVCIGYHSFSLAVNPLVWDNIDE
jgi:hypothetical protein